MFLSHVGSQLVDSLFLTETDTQRGSHGNSTLDLMQTVFTLSSDQ